MGFWSVVSIVAGAVILLFTIVDIFTTVFIIGSGAGVQSHFLADRAWRGALAMHDPESPRSHSLLRAVGPLILLAALLVWVAELTIGWTLIFVPAAFAQPGQVQLDDRLLFAIQSVIGRGGNRPPLDSAGGAWESILIPAGLSGVTVVSVGLAYVLPVLGAVAHKRSIAATVHALGESVDAMRRTAGESDGGGAFYDHLIALTPAISFTAERHRSYPVLHYFHSSDRHAALASSVSKLVLLLRDGMPGADTVDATITRPLGRAIHNLLHALAIMGLETFARNSEDIDSDRLNALGIDPLREGRAEEFPAVEWLRAYVRFDGWQWDEVARGDSRLSAGGEADRAGAGDGRRDDLKAVEGIGPKIERILRDAGIDSWAKLAEADVDRLREVLDGAGLRSGLNDPSTWPEQADRVKDEV